MEKKMGHDSRPETWKHIYEVRKNLRQISTELTRRALNHDQSKLSPPEVEVLDEVSVKLKYLKYDSPEYKEALAGMSVMTEHHYKMNDHHPEFHFDGVYGMNLIQLIEMLADWYAAGKRHEDGNLAKSIEMNAERFGYDERMYNLLISTAKYLGWIE